MSFRSGSAAGPRGLYRTTLLQCLFLRLATAFHNKAPPLHLPTSDPMRLRNCAGVSTHLTSDTSSSNRNEGLVLLFLDADSTFSKNQYYHFAKFSEIYPELHFVAIESFSLGFEPNVCKKVDQPEGSPARFLLDRHDFFGSSYAYEFFGIAPNEILMYNNGARFRYLPKTMTDMARPSGHQWVHTALAELDRTRTLQQDHNPKVKPLFLTSEFDTYRQFTVSEGEVGRIMTAHSKERCEQHCMEIGCTAMVLYGGHHCTFFAGEPDALKSTRTRYSNADLFVRKPIQDVNASQKLFKGILWAAVIIISATLVYYAFSKTQIKKNVANISSMGVSDSLMSGSMLSASAAMNAQEGAGGLDGASTGLNSLIQAADNDDEKYDDPAE